MNKKNVLLISVFFVISCVFSSATTFFITKRNIKADIQYITVEKEVIVEKEIVVEKTFDEYMNDYYEWPIDEPTWITSSVGPRNLSISNESFHRGDDTVGINKHVDINAAADGIVVEHWPAPNGYYKGHPVYGGYVIIQHDNGTYTAYAHMSSTSIRQGQKVKKGQKIGVIGSTGVSTGTHLHFEVIVKPSNFIKLS